MTSAVEIITDLRAVFTFACKGTLPTDVDLQDPTTATDTLRFLAAAQHLKNLKLPASETDNEQQDEQLQQAESEDDGSIDALDGERAAWQPAQKRRRPQAGDAVVVARACELIREHRFGHEHVGDSQLLRNPKVWGSLLQHMPMTALMRNLGRMTSIGALDDAAHAAKVVQQLTNRAAVRSGRLHPISLLEAMGVYGSGHGAKGDLTWLPNPAVCNALEQAFYLSFDNVAPTGLRWLLGVDVSGSMSSPVCGMTLSARDAAAAMAMALLRSEAPGYIHTMAFCSKFVPLPLTPDMTLKQVQTTMSRMDFGSTDCSQPMLYALEHRLEVDVFVVMTDNETWAGKVHPKEALSRYRKAMARPHAKLIVLAFSVTEFSIADPDDPLMMDVAGLDPAVPRIIHDFATGQL